jgi:hypothetical protein
MGGPTSSYAAAGIALEFIGAHKPPQPATKCFRQDGDTIKGVICLLFFFLFIFFLPWLIVFRIITQTFFTYKVQAYYQDRATQKGGNQHPCLEKDSNLTTPVSKKQKPAPKTAQPLKPTPLLSDVRYLFDDTANFCAKVPSRCWDRI